MRDIHEMIRERYQRMQTKHEMIQNNLAEFMSIADPNNASNLVFHMSELARMAQGYQDLTDAAGLPRGYVPEDMEPKCANCQCRRISHTGDDGCLTHASCDEWVPKEGES